MKLTIETVLKEEVNSTVSKLRKATDTREALALFREHSREELQSDLDFTAEVFGGSIRQGGKWIHE